jgi:MFS family permease
MPILLASTPVPMFETTRAMTLGRLYETSPLGCVAIFVLGAVFACQFGMSAVYAAGLGLGNAQISIFIGTIYLGGLLCQPPIGWLSDQMDRRQLIAVMTAIGAVSCLVVPVFGPSMATLVTAAFLMGGVSNPLYSLVVAYVNDYVEHEDMPAASAGLIMLNGIGAMGAPVLVGFLMDAIARDAFFLFMSGSFAAIALYALWRMRQRPVRVVVGEVAPVVPMSQVASPVAADAALEAAIEQVREDAERRETAEAG